MKKGVFRLDKFSFLHYNKQVILRTGKKARRAAQKSGEAHKAVLLWLSW